MTTAYPFYTPRSSTSSASTSAAAPEAPTTPRLHSADDPYSLPHAHARATRQTRADGLIGCLYPGATFVGTQRSGQSAYDVTVTLASSSLSTTGEPHLSGYLTIKGLTDEHPELTTYFDSEVITPNPHDGGNGFRTPRTWGACEARDWQHWERFKPFHALGITHLDQRPAIDSLAPSAGGSGGAVFMRWKERFLVPDHHVKDISGASFAGFYYVCVEAPFPGAASSSSPSTSASSHAKPQPRRSAGSTAPSSPAPATPPPATALSLAPDTTASDGLQNKAAHDPEDANMDGVSLTSSATPSPRSSPQPEPPLLPEPATQADAYSAYYNPNMRRSLGPSPSPGLVLHGEDDVESVAPTDILSRDDDEEEPDFDVDYMMELEHEEDEDDQDALPPGDGALMCGYYFHPHSDPFQKLILRHRPELDVCQGSYAFC